MNATPRVFAHTLKEKCSGGTFILKVDNLYLLVTFRSSCARGKMNNGLVVKTINNEKSAYSIVRVKRCVRPGKTGTLVEYKCRGLCQLRHFETKQRRFLIFQTFHNIFWSIAMKPTGPIVFSFMMVFENFSFMRIDVSLFVIIFILKVFI